MNSAPGVDVDRIVQVAVQDGGAARTYVTDPQFRAQVATAKLVLDVAAGQMIAAGVSVAVTTEVVTATANRLLTRQALDPAELVARLLVTLGTPLPPLVIPTEPT